MRFTTLLLSLAGLLTTGCLADVGGECTSERCRGGEGSGSGSGSATVDCKDKEEIATPLTLSSAADLEDLPSGCWSLNAKLRIEGPAITSLDKLGNLVEVNDLEIVDSGLTTFDSQQTIKVYGSLLVSGNSKLTSLDKIKPEKWVGETTGGSFQNAYVVRNNPALTNVGSLKYLSTVERELTVANNPQLSALDFSELERVGGALTITGTGVTSLSFTDLAAVGGIEIASNPALTSVTGLATATILGSLTLRGNANLTTVGSMNALTQITGNLVVDSNAKLTDLAGLTGAMQRIGGSVIISSNTTLTSLGQLSRLTQGIGSTVAITNNPALGYCKAVEIDHCVASGTVTITGNKNENNCNCWCGQ